MASVHRALGQEAVISITRPFFQNYWKDTVGRTSGLNTHSLGLTARTLFPSQQITSKGSNSVEVFV